MLSNTGDAAARHPIARELEHRIKNLVGVTVEVEVVDPYGIEHVTVGKAKRVRFGCNGYGKSIACALSQLKADQLETRQLELRIIARLYPATSFDGRPTFPYPRADREARKTRQARLS